MNYENQSNFLTAHRFDNSKIKKNKEKNKQREERKKKEPCRTSMQPTSTALRDHPFSTQNFPRNRKQLTQHYYETIEKKVVKHKSYRIYEHGRIFWVTVT